MKLFKSRLRIRFINLAAIVLVGFGLAGVLPVLYYSHTNNGSVKAQNFASTPAVKPIKSLISGNPVAISVPSVGINIPVINGYYYPKSKTWTLSLDKAQFATPTAKPNNLAGNTFIYGHYRLGVFYTLHRIQPGAEASITTDNGYIFTYGYYETYPTQPSDLSVLNYQGPPMLTLQTCSGSFYQNRQMYLFSLVKYEKT